MTREAAVSFALALLAAPTAARAGALKGTVRLEAPADAEVTVVYLENVPERQFAARPGRVLLSQKGARFSPALLPVLKGTHVDMTNDDWIDHSVFSYSLTKVFDVGLYAAGIKRMVTFDKVGVVEIGCFIHQSMSATILVLQNPFFTRLKPDGGFSLSGVPPGSYTLRVFTRGKKTVATAVEVPARGTVTLSDLSVPAAR